MTRDQGAAKAWAREHFRGFENILIPTMTEDRRELDEAALRHDVRQSMRHGFFGSLCAGIGLSGDEMKQFLGIAADEARGRHCLGMFVGDSGDLAAEMDLVGFAETAGLTHLVLDFPGSLRVESDEDVYRHARQYIDATRLPVTLWANDKNQWRGLHPSNMALEAFDRLADHPNVVALKIMATVDLGATFELCERFADRLLIGPVNLALIPLLSRHYACQWSGGWTQEALQSPDQPYAVDFFRDINRGDYQAAMRLYWAHLAPAFTTLMKVMAPVLPTGRYPWSLLKYYQWCVGGNGGPVRDDTPLSEEDMATVRATYQRIGVEPSSEPTAAFWTGRTGSRQVVGSARDSR